MENNSAMIGAEWCQGFFSDEEKSIEHTAFSEIDTGADELSHYGRKGMKWYQNIFTSGKQRRARKKRIKNLEKARQAKTEKKNLEEEKRKAIESGDANEVMKFKGKYTLAEMQYIQNRLNWEQSMKNLQKKDVDTGESTSKKIIDGVGKVTDAVNTGAKAWNTFANIYNAFSKKEVPLPKIDTNITGGNKKERIEEKNKIKEKAKKDERQKFIETATSDEIIKNFGKLSIDELRTASHRSTFESTIKKNWGKSPDDNTESSKTEQTSSTNNDDIPKAKAKNMGVDYGKSKVNKGKSEAEKIIIDTEFVNDTYVPVGESYALALLGDK